MGLLFSDEIKNGETLSIVYNETAEEVRVGFFIKNNPVVKVCSVDEFLNEKFLQKSIIEENIDWDLNYEGITKKVREEWKKYKEKNKEKFQEDERPLEYFDGDRFIPRRLAVEILNEKILIATRDTGDFYFYENGIYHTGECEAILMSMATQKFPNISKHQFNETMFHLRTMCGVGRDEMNKEQSLLHLKNGILNLKTMKLEEFSPEIISTIQMPVEYDEDAKCPRFKKFLSEVISEEDLSVMQELFGFCLLKDYRFQKAVMLVGSGSNGKSVLLNVIKEFLGSDNISNVSLQDFDSRRGHFSKAYLYNKLANIYGDLSNRAMYETGIFKQLTGGDQIQAEFKFKSAFKFTNFAKLIFSCNQLPEVKDNTDAFYRRWIFFNFPNKFKGNNANPKILKELTTEKELSGILNWAINGLKKLLKQGGFSNEKSEEELKEYYDRMSSSLKAFIMDFVEAAAQEHIPKEDFYNIYTKYCVDNNLPIKSKDLVSKELPALIPVTSTRLGESGNRYRAWNGIRFVSKVSNLFLHSSKQSEGSHEGRLYKLIGKRLDTLDTIKESLSKNTILTTEQLQKKTGLDLESLKELLKKMEHNGEIFSPEPGTWKKNNIEESVINVGDK